MLRGQKEDELPGLDPFVVVIWSKRKAGVLGSLGSDTSTDAIKFTEGVYLEKKQNKKLTNILEIMSPYMYLYLPDISLGAFDKFISSMLTRN